VSGLTAPSALRPTVYSHGHVGMLTASYAILAALAQRRWVRSPRFLIVASLSAPPRGAAQQLASALLHVQNVEGGVYQVNTTAGGVLTGGGRAMLDMLKLHINLPRPRPPVWLLSASFLPLSEAYANSYLRYWCQADALALRESASAKQYSDWQQKVPCTRSSNLTIAHSLDIALLAPVYHLDGELAQELARQTRAWPGGNVFRVALMTSSLHSGWPKFLAGLVPALTQIAEDRHLHIRMFIPIENDLQALHYAVNGSSRISYDVASGDTPLEQVYQLSQAHVLITGRYHGAVIAAGLRLPAVVLPAKTIRSKAFVNDVQQHCHATTIRYADVSKACGWQSDVEGQHSAFEISCTVNTTAKLVQTVLEKGTVLTDVASESIRKCTARLASYNFPHAFYSPDEPASAGSKYVSFASSASSVQHLDAAYMRQTSILSPAAGPDEFARQKRFVAAMRRILQNLKSPEKEPQCIDANMDWTPCGW